MSITQEYLEAAWAIIGCNIDKTKFFPKNTSCSLFFKCPAWVKLQQDNWPRRTKESQLDFGFYLIVIFSHASFWIFLHTFHCDSIACSYLFPYLWVYGKENNDYIYFKFSDWEMLNM